MLFEAHEISKSFDVRAGKLDALDKASVSVGEGEIVGLVGTSGSGKSTLAAVIAGIELADSGTLRFCGASCDASTKPSRRPREYRQVQLDMQMVFQHPASSFSPRMRVGEGIKEGVAYRGVPQAEQEQRMLDALDAVGLPRAYARKFAWELSGGECQRAAIARAIVGNPKMLLADEPTSALDVTIQAQIVRLLADLCRDRGMACLFISHDLALVQGLCRRVYVMDAGRIVEEGAASAVLDDPQSDAAKRLVDSIIEI